MDGMHGAAQCSTDISHYSGTTCHCPVDQALSPCLHLNWENPIMVGSASTSLSHGNVGVSAGELRLNDWVQNCLQLAGYYIMHNAFAMGEYCMHAATAVARKYGGYSGLGGDRPAGSADAAATSSSSDAAASGSLDGDVVANLQLGWAKLSMYRLVASHDTFVEGRELDMPYPDSSHFPSMLE